jgi:diacylglycerol kinase family enzyme
MILDQTRRHALIQYFPVRESFKIEAERPLPVQGDGESVGKTPISAKVLPGALHVIVPAGEEPE